MRPALFFAVILAACNEASGPTTPPAKTASEAKPLSGSGGAANDAETADLAIGPQSIVGSDRAVLATLNADHSLGVDAAFKRHGARDLWIVPVVDYLRARVPAPTERALLVRVEPSASYRTIVEVLFSAEQAGLRSIDLRASSDEKRHVVFFAARGFADGFNVSAWIVRDGVSIHTRDGNLGPGCETTGAEIAVPRTGGAIDHAALRRCAETLERTSATSHRITVTANSSTPFSELLDAVDALRGAGGELFSEATFGLMKQDL